MYSFENAARLLDDLSSEFVTLGDGSDEVFAFSQRGEESSDEGVSSTVSVNNVLNGDGGDINELDGGLTVEVASDNNSWLGTLSDDHNTGTGLAGLRELCDLLGDTNTVGGLKSLRGGES